MSAKEDYQQAKKLVADFEHIIQPVGNTETLVDAIRAAITGAHLYERARWSKFLKEWADDLEENDEGYVALFFRDVADRIKNDDYTFPDFDPMGDEDSALIAEDEREL